MLGCERSRVYRTTQRHVGTTKSVYVYVVTKVWGLYVVMTQRECGGRHVYSHNRVCKCIVMRICGVNV